MPSGSLWWLLLITLGVLAGFYFMFKGIVDRYSARISSLPEKTSLWHTFPLRGWILIVCMTCLGIALKFIPGIPKEFTASFYSGLGPMLVMAAAALSPTKNELYEFQWHHCLRCRISEHRYLSSPCNQDGVQVGETKLVGLAGCRTAVLRAVPVCQKRHNIHHHRWFRILLPLGHPRNVPSGKARSARLVPGKPHTPRVLREKTPPDVIKVG